MNLRKVQLTGGSSLTVTLPKTWTDRVQLKAGDVIGFVEMPDGALAVRSQIRGDRKLSEYVVDVEETDAGYLFRKIIAAYLMGYDVVRLQGKRPFTAEARSIIRSAVRRIVGLEIVDEQPSSIALQDFLDPREFHMEKAVRRMGILTQAMQEEAFSALRDPKPEVIQSEQDRDAEVDRLYWLVNKQYHAILRDTEYATKMGLNPSQGLNFLLVARVIERTADHADRIAGEALQLAGHKVSAAFLERLEKHGRKSMELFQAGLQFFIKKDSRKANTVIEDADKLLENQKRLLKEAFEFGGESVAHLSFIIESIGRTAAYAADLGEVAINHRVASSEGSVASKG